MNGYDCPKKWFEKNSSRVACAVNTYEAASNGDGDWEYKEYTFLIKKPKNNEANSEPQYPKSLKWSPIKENVLKAE